MSEKPNLEKYLEETSLTLYGKSWSELNNAEMKNLEILTRRAVDKHQNDTNALRTEEELIGWVFEERLQQIKANSLVKDILSYGRQTETKQPQQPQITIEKPKHPEKKAREFYTQNGWKGDKYEKTRNLALKEIAKRIKKEALAKHPEINLSVRTEHFSGGRAIRIEITKAPFKLINKKCLYPEMANLPPEKIPKFAWSWEHTPKAKTIKDSVQAIADQYRYDDSDGMIDYFSTNFYCNVTYDYDLLRVEEKELGII